MRGARRRRPTAPGAAVAPLHVRNRYRSRPPDFYALGEQYASFRRHLRDVDDEKRRASMAWDDPLAVRELTATLLRHDFGLEWTMPSDRLCPPVPNRLNYLHWVEDLLALTGASDATTSGIDVGTGASCIYALLGAKMNGWRFLATEVDPESVASARANVTRNNLGDHITVRQTYTNRLLTEPLEAEPADRKFDFTMCNPPFFDHMDEADTNPSNCCMGSESEMVFPGGEVNFIGIMIQESIAFKDRIVWFTSMVGRKSSLRKLLAMLRENQIPTYRTTEFFQGRTKRWGIAWTFAAMPPPDSSSKVLGKRKEAHRRQELTFEVPKNNGQGCASIEEIGKRLHDFAALTSGLDLIRTSTTVSHCFEFVQRTEDPSINGKLALFAGKIRVLQCNEKEAFSVSIMFEKGERSEFWKVADKMAAAVIRTGRKWRRQKGDCGAST